MVPELYGTIGFDVIWIDTEHGYMDPKDVQNAMIGARSGGACAFVRVPWHDAVMAKPLLDLGADGIIFPMVSTPEMAAEMVAACRYPPVGTRGFGPFRATGYGSQSGSDYIQTNSCKVWVVPQIEHIDAVNNLDAILAVPGIDAIIVGVNDLSGSMGLLGQCNHPEVKKHLDTIAGKAKAANIPFGVSMIYDDEAIADWARRGANIIFADNEGSYISSGARNTLGKLQAATRKK